MDGSTPNSAGEALDQLRHQVQELASYVRRQMAYLEDQENRARENATRRLADEEFQYAAAHLNDAARLRLARSELLFVELRLRKML